MDDKAAPKSDASEPVSNGPPLVVGIGASAGGLNAFSTFLDHMPADSGMAFVLVQHLDPEHRSMLVELLSRHTSMPIAAAENGMALEAGHVFVIPPDSTLKIADGHLQVDTPAPPRDQRRPIDTFFESLASDQEENAVCIILSGTGSDGARGLAAVKTAGGLTLAQAEYDHVAMQGMPHSANETGRVDHVLAIEEMPELLIDYRDHMRSVSGYKDNEGTRADAVERLAEISRLLRSRTGHDFSEYKNSTRIRRIQRRMQVHQIDTIDDYTERLRADPAERDALFRELLIGVTGFFRDPEVWTALQHDIVPELLENKNAEDSLRVWVAGCSTGEEAYSIAILLKEAMAERDTPPMLQVFATDIDTAAIEVARTGWYPAPMTGLAPHHVRRWFNEQQGGYTPVKALRDSCIFSVHDLGRDPPFSRLDLVVCRNLLIYIGKELQERILRKFHYGLRSGGYLFLGLSESATDQATLFSTRDKKHRLFQRRDADMPIPVDVAGPTTPAPRPTDQASVSSGRQPLDEDEISHAVRTAMEPYAPAYIVVDRHYQIQRFSGGSARHYLEPSDGVASLNLFDLLRKSLRPATRKAVQTTFAKNQVATQADLFLRIDGQNRRIELIVSPLSVGTHQSEFCVVAFRDGGPVSEHPSATSGQAEHARADSAVLEQELHTARAQLQTATTELARAQEETRSVTEEYQSVNEELQSSNEELETSKEEMQSINEELQTVNAELNGKNERLTSVNSDLRNLLESTQIATIFLDDDLRIKNFTPSVAELFHLRDSDYGRPITELANRLDYDQLEQDIEAVLRKLTVVEREVGLADGTTFIMHIRLYRTVANVIDGVVITFFDITERKHYESQRAWLAAIVDSSQDAIISQDRQGRITSWNTAAEQIFGVSSETAIGTTLVDLLRPKLSAAALSTVERITEGQQNQQDEIRIERPEGAIDLALTVSPVIDNAGHTVATSTIARDISTRIAEESHRELLLQELNHRVKNVLATVQSIMMLTLDQAPAAFQNTFTQRIQALAQTHNLLTESQWQGVSLRELLETELRPYGDIDNPRWQLDGEPITLAAPRALSLGMAFHELTTNAAKHGSLSTDGGRVIVQWQIQHENGHDMLRLDWREYGGPVAEEPEKQGFGLCLVQDGLAHELDAQVWLDFKPDGLSCTLVLPLVSDTDEQRTP